MSQMPRTRVVQVEEQRSSRQEVAPDAQESPLYGVAMLKIAMELKKPEARPLDEILSDVLTKMNIAEEDFRQFLAQNGGLLRTIAHRRTF